ncbi:MAG TPA: TonB family protein [Bryobacteraceae bacterium]|jgi:TonB family protein|nr:TonB family protein [Bryobacteraceae bacterium]
METLTPQDNATTSTETELHLWLETNRARDFRQWRKPAGVSAAFHFVLILALLLMPDAPVNQVQERRRVVERVTPLYIPTEFTQKAPNKGKVEKELKLESIAPHPLLKSPTPAAPAKRVPSSAPLPPPPQVAQVQPKPVVIEPPPKVDDPAAQGTQIAKLIGPAPPPPAEPPKLALEQVAPAPKTTNVTGPRPSILAIPNPSVQNAIHDLARNGMQAGLTVGDVGADDSSIGSGLNLPPSAGSPRSSLQLKSDPMGVDFQPYLIQVLAAVRRNWNAVYPEAARRGQRGRVAIEFSVAKQGAVVKVVFATESGAKALDQSAVAAISASNPLPPLPTGFKGDRIVLQLTFLYNMPR